MKEIMIDGIFGKSFATHWYIITFFDVLELLYFELPTNPQINKYRLAGIQLITLLKWDK